MTTVPQAQVVAIPGDRALWRGHIMRGSAILLFSTGLVAATNLFYNVLIARMLGASGFGHASALYTLLMLLTAVTFSFQIVTSKFIARNYEVAVKDQIYATMLRRSWQIGVGIAVLIAAASAPLDSYLNLPARHDLVLLAAAAGVYVPLGVRRGRMQGSFNFRALAINVVVEVMVKFGGALLFLHFGWGVTGVMTAVLLSIVAAYIAGSPGSLCQALPGRIKIAPFGEGMQAVLYFIGQVVLSNLDILLVKHFFPPSEAGIYAAVALVGRVVFMLSWSVVSSMFPVSASHAHRDAGRSVLYTGLLLVGGVTSIFIAAIALAPQIIWTTLLGKTFLFSSPEPFSVLLTKYAVMTAVYSMAVVIMMYEISRRTGTAAWVQLGASICLALAIWFRHDSLSQVIQLQLFVMCGLLIIVMVPLFLESGEPAPDHPRWEPFPRLRRVAEAEIIAEFLRGEFHHPEFDSYRENFKPLVGNAHLDDRNENLIRRSLLFRRRGRLWRELPADTEWWEIELSARDLARLQSFPRNEWRRFTGAGFALTEMVGRIKLELAQGRESPFLKKIGEIASDLRQDGVPDGVLLIGIDERHPLTIIEGNHRMAAALLTMPESAHRRFRFYCGLSSSMNLCCWHRTGLRSLTRYARHSIRYIFQDGDLFVARTLREKLAEIQAP